jgi:hypothetical protein
LLRKSEVSPYGRARDLRSQVPAYPLCGWLCPPQRPPDLRVLEQTLLYIVHLCE